MWIFGMNYIYPYIPTIATFIAALFAFLILEKIYKLKPLPVSFDSPKTEVLVSLIPYMGLVAFAVFAFWRLGTQNATTDNRGQEYDLQAALLQLLANAIILLPFGITLVIRKQSLKTMGVFKENLLPSVLGGLVVSALACVFFKQISLKFWLSAPTLFQLLAQLGVGFSEEMIFRGYLLSRFSAFFKRTQAELLTAGMFAIVHIPQRLFYNYTRMELIIDLVVLLIWGWVFNRIVRRIGNITGLAILHSVINVIGA